MTDLDRLCEKLGITATSKYGARKPNNDPAWQCNAYTVTLRRTGDQRRTLTVDFFQGLGITRDPTPADVLSCLLSDVNSVENTRSFEEWASDLGYDTDSREAERVYNACKALAPKLHRFLGDDFDALTQAASDY